MRRWLATMLYPEFERTERRFWYLWHQVDDVNKWCDGEARDATQWLLDQDRDYWRSIDAPPGARATPWGIQQFREWIYKKRDSMRWEGLLQGGHCRNCGDPSAEIYCGMCREMGAGVAPSPSLSRDRAMECLGYSPNDDWRKECCKLNMQLAVARCTVRCSYEVAGMRGSSPQGVPSKLTGKRERSVTPQTGRAARQGVGVPQC